MHDFIVWFGKFTDSQTFAAIVGALIGIIPAFILSIWYDKRKKELEDYETRKAWLNGLTAELNHITKVINEITTIVQSGSPSTKRLNSDFIAEARLKIFTYNMDVEFLECLTNAYRDIIHTNGMLKRLEDMVPNHSQFCANVLASMTGVSNSVNCLKCNNENKIKNIKKPRLIKI